jgi:hypothetical protein
MQLAVQDWRVDFTVAGQDIEVNGVRSGYRASQLTASGRQAEDPLRLHREYKLQFP